MSCLFIFHDVILYLSSTSELGNIQPQPQTQQNSGRLFGSLPKNIVSFEDICST